MLSKCRFWVCPQGAQTGINPKLHKCIWNRCCNTSYEAERRGTVQAETRQVASLWVREVMVEFRPEGKEVKKEHPDTGNSTSKGPVARETRWAWGIAGRGGEKPWVTHVSRQGQAPQSPPGPIEEHWGGPNGFQTRRHVYLGSLSFYIVKAVLQLQHTE